MRKKVGDTISSKDYQEIQFRENQQFVCLPRDQLVQAIIINLEQRLMSGDNVSSVTQNRQGSVELFEIINLVQPQTWKIEEVEVP